MIFSKRGRTSVNADFAEHTSVVEGAEHHFQIDCAARVPHIFLGFADE